MRWSGSANTSRPLIFFACPRRPCNRGSGGARMALPIEQIDTSLIEELMGLKRDGETLRARLARMAGEADKVSAPVFQRVHADYQARLAALDERAEPKKQQEIGRASCRERV